MFHYQPMRGDIPLKRAVGSPNINTEIVKGQFGDQEEARPHNLFLLLPFESSSCVETQRYLFATTETLILSKKW
jgi:hypothetical protein